MLFKKDQIKDSWACLKTNQFNPILMHDKTRKLRVKKK